MSRNLSLRDAYQQMFDWLEQPELFKLSRGRLEYADVFPLIYLKMRLQGVNNPRAGVKHLLIDEMQDYSPLQYTVLARLFSCRKTVLGDASQALNPHGSSSAAEIQRAFQTALCVKLTKSYRSTWQIMQLALSIAPNSELEPMRRDGRMPEVYSVDRPQQAQQQLLKLIADYQASAYRSLALITKTQHQAKHLHRSLTAAGIELRLLDEYSSGFSAGILVCTAYLAKGLEFDRVIVCHVNADTYASEMDRNLLYVACTRAMHELDLVGAGAPSPLLADWPPAA